MFLLGGTAFSGKTLLAHLLNQGQVVCLDEPDFHDAGQRHRGVAFLRGLFPDKRFPDQPERGLTFQEGVELLEQCEEVLRPSTLGVKAAGRVFVEYAKIYRASNYPVIGMIRDIRDVVAEGPLPEWIGDERQLSEEFRMVWTNRHLCDLWIRYEDFVMNPDGVLESISRLIGYDLESVANWSAESVHGTMFKLDRHDMLRTGQISHERVGMWRSSGRTFSDDTMMTAEMMGYGQ
jgi:hypothetical protein